MAINNNLQKVQEQKTQKPKTRFSVAIQKEEYKQLINNTIKDPKRASRFIASVTSAVAANPLLQDCAPSTILSAGLEGEALNLCPSPQLGQFYILPYKDNSDKKNPRLVAQFQVGYKGYIQLAIRSGYYKRLNVLAIKEGELLKYNPLTEVFEARIIEDYQTRKKAKTTGYYAMFEYLNGFVKELYWSKNEMLDHATTYSKSYRKDLAKHENHSYWSKNFDAMAYKTMLKQLISKWGIMSTELQIAIENDMAVIDTNGNVIYVDNAEDVEEPIEELKNNTEADELTGEIIVGQNQQEVEEYEGDL